MKKVIIGFIVLFIVFNSLIYGEENYKNKDYYNIKYNEKDPFIAGLLSATMMGLGQFYAKEYTKGSLFVLVDFIKKGSLIWLIANLNKKYTNDEKGDNIVEWNEITRGDKIMILTYMSFYFGSKIYCIVDAMKSAEKYNMRMKELMKKEIDINFNFNLQNNNKEIAMGFRRKF